MPSIDNNTVRVSPAGRSHRSALLTAATAVLLSLAPIVAGGTSASAAVVPQAAGGTTLQSGQVLTAGQSIQVASGEYRFTMQGDGNLVEYTLGDTPLWASGTAGNSGAQVDMQGDGNLVVYNSAHTKALWATGTSGHAGAYLAIQGDGNVVVYAGSTALWATGTNIVGGGRNDYPYANSAVDVSDGDGFLTRECTSFVAWRVRNNLKISGFSNGWRGGWFGNADTWASNASSLGLVVNSSPSVDSVAVLPPNVDGAGSLGHVAFVIGVGSGTITVEDYNYADSYDGDQYYDYSQHTIATAGVSFIHFR